MKQSKIKIVATTRCSDDYGVTTVEMTGAEKRHQRKKPCSQCPWRSDLPVGVFPADAFRESAKTSYDMAESVFGCHMSKIESGPHTCVGFLLRHGENNLQVRFATAEDRFDFEGLNDGGYPLYESYREMAVANGVDAAESCLEPVRGNDDVWDVELKKWVRVGG
jgi:hypothetical protein